MQFLNINIKNSNNYLGLKLQIMFFFNCCKIHIKFIILSVKFSSVKFIHFVGQLVSGTSSSCKTEALYSLNNNSPFSLLPFFFVSRSFSALDTSPNWNRTIFAFLLLVYYRLHFKDWEEEEVWRGCITKNGRLILSFQDNLFWLLPKSLYHLLLSHFLLRFVIREAFSLWSQVYSELQLT